MLFANLVNIHRSTFFRLTCLFMLAFVAATLITVGWIDEAMENYLEEKALSFSEEQIREKQDFFQSYGSAALAEDISEFSLQNTGSREIYVLFDAGCEVVAGAPGRLPADFQDTEICDILAAVGGTRVFDLSRQISALDYQSEFFSGELEVDVAVARFARLSNGESVLAVLVVPEIEETREFLDETLAWLVGLLLVVGLAGAIFLTQAVSYRLDKVNSISRDIREGDLSRRVPLNGSHDEFDHLSMNLNSMLDRIEQVLESHKQVTNDITHDLRTPLTRIQARVETLKSKLIQGADASEQIAKIEAEIKSILEISSALLRIAGIESGRAINSFSEVDFAAICFDAIELHQVMAESRNLSLEHRLEEPSMVKGDRNLLFQAVTNIIENAIKYSPAGGKIFVALKHDGNGYKFTVTDEGPGISETEIANVFKRFYRLESHRGTDGHGLGLSLVKAVVELHGGTIQLTKLDVGLEVCVLFPSPQLKGSE